MMHRASSPRRGGTPTPDRWQPRTSEDKDKMIAKLVRDNEVLMGEVQALDQTLRETREAFSQLRHEKVALEANSTTGQRLLDTVGEQAALDRRERERDRQSYEALAAQHAADKVRHVYTACMRTVRVWCTCVWYVRGVCVACAWRGVCMACAWRVHGVCAWRVRLVCGVCVACAPPYARPLIHRPLIRAGVPQP